MSDGYASLSIIREQNYDEDLIELVPYDNPSRASFRADKGGHIGIGVDRFMPYDESLKAWLHIKRLYPTECNLITEAMFLVENEFNANNFIIDQNGNVGIGTPNPQYLLDIAGTLNYSNIIAQNLSGDGSALYNLNTSNVSDGILQVVYGGTGTNTSTGDGSVVLSDSPNITGNATFDNITVNSNLSFNADMYMNAHIVPIKNNTFDLGSPGYQIRHLYLSSNSLWIGGDYKIGVADGTLSVVQRDVNKIPSILQTNQDILDLIRINSSDEQEILLNGTYVLVSSVTLSDWYDLGIKYRAQMPYCLLMIINLNRH
eukprot:763349-Hanusia_phi.AAC.2